MGGAIGAVVAGLLLGLSEVLGWRLAWATAAAGALVLLVATRGSELPAGRPGEKVPLGEGLRTLRRQRQVHSAIAFALGATVESGVSTWGVLQLRSQLDAGLLVGAGGAVLGFAIGIVTRLSISGLQTARAARAVMTAGTMAAARGWRSWPASRSRSSPRPGSSLPLRASRSSGRCSCPKSDEARNGPAPSSARSRPSATWASSSDPV